jgi:uncharacterized protein (TIGR02001 family)
LVVLHQLNGDLTVRKSLLSLGVAAVLGSPLVATAQQAPASPHTFSGNLTLASEYIFRGIAQTRGKPALQGGFDYAHASGLYAGIWGSNISWISDGTATASSSLEVDLYGGYKGTITGDLGFDVGILTYNYPGSGKPTGAAKPETTELYAGLSYKWLTAKYSVTTGSLFGWTKTADPNAKTKGSGYLDLTGTFNLTEGLDLIAHVGHQSVKGRSSASYTDWKVGLAKDVGFGTVGVAYSATNAKADCGAGDDYCFVHHSDGRTYDAGRSRLLLTFSKTF